MRLHKVISKRIRDKGVAADVNAVVAANVGEKRSSTRVRSTQRVVQRNGRTVVDESSTEAE